MQHYASKYKQHYVQILKLAGPIVAAQLGAIITGYADTIMVGRYSTQALAAASLVNNVFNLMILVTLGFSYGMTPLIGPLHARGDTRGVGAMLRNAVAANAAYAALLLAAWTALYYNLHRLGMPAELLPLVRSYYVIVLWSMVPLALINVLRQYADAVGHTSLAMWIMTAGNVMNIAGNYALIYGKWGAPEMGLDGAGISTLAARVAMAAAFAAALLLTRRHRAATRQALKARTSWNKMLAVARLSLPISMQMGMETGVFTAASLMVARLGADTLAAYQVLVMLGSIGFMVYYAVGAAASIKIAHCCGTADTAGVRAAAHVGYVLILACAVTASVTFVTGGRWIVAAFTPDPAVQAIALGVMWLLVAYQFGDATQVAFANALRGIGRSMPVMRIAFVSYVAVGIPLLYVLAFTVGWGIAGIYAGFVVALLMAGVLFAHSFYSALRRQHRNN